MEADKIYQYLNREGHNLVGRIENKCVIYADSFIELQTQFLIPITIGDKEIWEARFDKDQFWKFFDIEKLLNS